MPLNTTDQIRLNSAAGHLQLGDEAEAVCVWAVDMAGGDLTILDQSLPPNDPWSRKNFQKEFYDKEADTKEVFASTRGRAGGNYLEIRVD